MSGADCIWVGLGRDEAEGGGWNWWDGAGDKCLFSQPETYQFPLAFVQVSNPRHASESDTLSDALRGIMDPRGGE
jgi:hypothetical protein